MQDRESELRRIPLPRTPVNRVSRRKGAEESPLPSLNDLLLYDLVGAHHVVVLMLEDVAVEDVLLCTPHPWRQLKRRADLCHDPRVCGDRVLEAPVVRLQGQRSAGIEGRGIRVGLSPLTCRIEHLLVAFDIEG